MKKNDRISPNKINFFNYHWLMPSIFRQKDSWEFDKEWDFQEQEEIPNDFKSFNLPWCKANIPILKRGLTQKIVDGLDPMKWECARMFLVLNKDFKEMEMIEVGYSVKVEDAAAVISLVSTKGEYIISYIELLITNQLPHGGIIKEKDSMYGVYPLKIFQGDITKRIFQEFD